MIILINKCPYCGSLNFNKIKTDNNNYKFVLTQVDITTNEFFPNLGLPIDAYGCVDCKGIYLANENLSFHE